MFETIYVETMMYKFAYIDAVAAVVVVAADALCTIISIFSTE